jgi:leader peptidase (prepilin peptidase) / N-methyltransferase
MAHHRDLSTWEAIGCAVAGLLTALACSPTAPPAIAVLSGYLLFTAIAITIVDYRSFIIPDIFSLPAIPLGIVANLISADVGLHSSAVADSLIGAAVGGSSFYLLRSSYRRFRGFEGLGMGDVKLATAAGAWVGLEALPIVLFMATGAAVSAVAVRYVIGAKESITRTTPIPFGTFLAPSLWLIWFYRAVVAPI